MLHKVADRRVLKKNLIYWHGNEAIMQGKVLIQYILSRVVSGLFFGRLEIKTVAKLQK